MTILRDNSMRSGVCRYVPKRIGTSTARSLFSSVVPAREVLLQPAIERDEQITAAHLSDFELGHSRAPVPPGDRNDRPRIAANDGLQRDLNREIEVRRKKRAATVDHLGAIGLESVG